MSHNPFLFFRHFFAESIISRRCLVHPILNSDSEVCFGIRTVAIPIRPMDWALRRNGEELTLPLLSGRGTPWNCTISWSRTEIEEIDVYLVLFFLVATSSNDNMTISIGTIIVVGYSGTTFAPTICMLCMVWNVLR